MNRVLVFSIGSGLATAVALALLSSKAKGASAAAPLPPQPPSPPPPNTRPPVIQHGEQQKVALSIPGGWRRATSAEVSSLPELGARAVQLRNQAGFTSLAYGTLAPFLASDGHEYATWVEQHFHEPGGAVKPWGLHHGVTVLAKVRTA